MSMQIKSSKKIILDFL